MSEFYIDEHWHFTGTVRDANGTAVDMSGGSVRVRIGRKYSSAILLTVTCSLVSAPAGTWRADIAPSSQGSILPGVHTYEVEAVLPDTVVSIQGAGDFTVKSSRFTT
jgi:hypothetical protein